MEYYTGLGRTDWTTGKGTSGPPVCPPPGAAGLGFAALSLAAPGVPCADLDAPLPVPDEARGGGGSISFPPVRARLDGALSPSASFLLVPAWRELLQYIEQF